MSNYMQTLESYDGSDYISVNGFTKSRRKNNLKELLHFYVDIDVKKTKIFEEIADKYEDIDDVFLYNNIIDQEYINLILDTCKENNMPLPSKINNSGNGYHVYWTIKGYSKAVKFDKFYGASHQQINAYERLEKLIVEKFKTLGGDKRATDVTRLLRVENSFNPSSWSSCITIWENEDVSEIEFREMADALFKYKYTEVTKYKKITKKQKEFLLKNEIVTKNQVSKLDKFEAKTLIDNFIKSERCATDKQKEYLKVLNIEFNDDITVYDADTLIKEAKAKNDHNNDYIYRLLNNIYKQGDITEGNRAYFFYYLGVSYRRLLLTEEEAVSKAKEFNKKLQMKDSEVIYHILQAYKPKYSLNIKKSTILDHLNLEVSKYLKKQKKPQKRANKAKLSSSYKKFKSNIFKYLSMSVREIAKELEISKSSASNLKQKFKKEIKNRKNIKEEISKKINEFLNVKRNKKTLEEQVVIIVKKRIKNGFRIKVNRCPLILVE